MKHLLSKVFGLLSIFLLSAAVITAVCLRDACPITADALASADVQTEQLMTAICNGDYESAEQYIIGNPSLTPEKDFSNALTKALWDAYLNSLTYQFQGACYADDYGVYRDVSVTLLDIPALMTDLQNRAALLHREADSNSMTDTLADAVPSMAASKEYVLTRTITLQLTGHGGRWMVQASPQLIDLLQGSMGGA